MNDTTQQEQQQIHANSPLQVVCHLSPFPSAMKSFVQII